MVLKPVEVTCNLHLHIPTFQSQALKEIPLTYSMRNKWVCKLEVSYIAVLISLLAVALSIFYLLYSGGHSKSIFIQEDKENGVCFPGERV